MADDSIMNYVMLGVAILAVPIVIGLALTKPAEEAFIIATHQVGWTPGVMSNFGIMCKKGVGPEGSPLTAQDVRDCRDVIAMVNNLSRANSLETTSLGDFVKGYNSS